MKILILCHYDWAGTGYAIAEVLRANTPHEVRHAVLKTFGMGYKVEEQVDEGGAKLIERLAWADVWNLHEDLYEHLPIPTRWKPTVFTFRGTWYRQRYPLANKQTRSRGILTTISHDLSMYGPEWLPRPWPSLASMYDPDKTTFRVCHAPTGREKKGTALVLQAFDGGIPGTSLELVENTSHAACLARKARCRLLIDQVGKVGYGYGNNGLEAWAMGMPVISSCSDAQAAKLEADIGGPLPFIRVRTAADIRATVERLRDDPAEWFRWADMGMEVRQRLHDPRSVAARFMDFVNRATVKFYGGAT